MTNTEIAAKLQCLAVDAEALQKKYEDLFSALTNFSDEVNDAEEPGEDHVEVLDLVESSDFLSSFIAGNSPIDFLQNLSANFMVLPDEVEPEEDDDDGDDV